MVTKKISRREAASNFDALVSTLERPRAPVMVEDAVRGVAVLVHPQEYEAAEREALLATLD